ncbi:hypothetical protein [Halorubrum persicum]|nr:hypothetical protein [Halorubrum persicum]
MNRDATGALKDVTGMLFTGLDDRVERCRTEAFHINDGRYCQ